MIHWEIERDPSDGQYDVIKDGRVTYYAFPDLAAVAQASDINDEDTVTVPGGHSMSGSEFRSRHG